MKVIYISYGDQAFLKQTLLSAESAVSRGFSPEGIFVYTDNDVLFRKYGYRTSTVSASDIHRHKGALGFTHRVKVCLLMDFASRFEDDFLYVDSDTFWLSDPGNIQPQLAGGSPVMHKYEGLISSTFHPRYFALLRENRLGRFQPADATHVKMYNAGAIGLTAQSARSILPDVLEMTDALTMLLPQHMTWTEQFAFCLAFAKQTSISTIEPSLLHYWQCNRELQFLVRHLSFDEIVEMSKSPGELQRLCSISTGLQSTPLFRWLNRWEKQKRSVRKRITWLKRSLHRSVVLPPSPRR